MFISVDTLHLVLEIGGLDKVGTYTGDYYTATFSAQISTPMSYGIVGTYTGAYLSLFYDCPIAFMLEILCTLGEKHGEAIPHEIVDQVSEEIEDRVHPLITAAVKPRVLQLLFCLRADFNFCTDVFDALKINFCAVRYCRMLYYRRSEPRAAYVLGMDMILFAQALWHPRLRRRRNTVSRIEHA
jgi:hypothetical protein